MSESNLTTRAGSGQVSGSASGAARPPVVLTMPADKNYVALVRSAASHLGVRAGFTMAEITDLRLAVDEACGLFLLPDEFELTGHELRCVFIETGVGLR